MVLVLGVLAVQSLQAQTFSVVYSFTGGPDGSLASPTAGLVADEAGNLYGTAAGFDCPRCQSAPGAVFKIDGKGKETTIHTFNCETEGCNPVAGLVRDKAGNLYGTTYTGPRVLTRGTVFKVDESGHETLLHTFTGPNGAFPYADLLRDAEGNLFGTTLYGGDLTCNPKAGCGTVFELSKAGKFKLLHSFLGGPDGSEPDGGLVMDAQGNLYGTTASGGGPGCSSPANSGCGTVFKIDTEGKKTVLYRFAGGMDGSFPRGNLVWDEQSNLYGTTASGGGSGCQQGLGCGTVFKLDKNGQETVLYSFGRAEDGADPVAGLVRDSAGYLYGTTVQGGGKGRCSASSCGTVFKLDASGKETVLHRFSGRTDGGFPEGRLLQETDGTLYGTTDRGGDLKCFYNSGVGCGVVFKLTPR
jgi:uncharacterized repeat protein (TIGR03803 family)